MGWGGVEGLFTKLVKIAVVMSCVCCILYYCVTSAFFQWFLVFWTSLEFPSA